VACPSADEESLRRYNCNQDGECEAISGVFNCKRGHCANLSSIYHCRPVADGSIIDAEKVISLLPSMTTLFTTTFQSILWHCYSLSDI
jgi:hypothetical protein